MEALKTCCEAVHDLLISTCHLLIYSNQYNFQHGRQGMVDATLQ